MKRNSVDDKRAERYLIVAAIIALVTIFTPEIVIAVLYGTNVWDLEIEHTHQVMHLMAVGLLGVMAIGIDVSRRHAIQQAHKERYAITEVIITGAIIIQAAAIAVPPSFYIPNPFEKIVFNSVSVTHTYTVTVNFVNTGATSTRIASVLLNSVPYNDTGWAGTIKPTVTGNLTLKSVIDVGVSNTGTITFSDDCVYIPNGYRLTAGVTVKITIHTTGGKDYETSVTLP